MLENLRIAINAVMPFIVYLTFGFGVRKAGFVDEALLRKLNKMIFKCFFPIMMFFNLYDRADQFTVNTKLLVLTVGSVLAVLVVLWFLVPVFVKENPQRGVMIQGIYRSNIVLFAIPLTVNIFGEEGAVVATAIVATIVPLYNVAAVVVLEYYRGTSVKIGKLLKNVATNPLIMGAVVGLIFVFCKIRLPQMISKPLSQFSSMSTPLALFILGGTLQFSSIKKNAHLLFLALGIKMILLPFIAVFVSIFLDLQPIERFVYLMVFATPVAASSYPMAQSMGGDDKLAGEFVGISTILSAITIFLWVYALRTFGLM